MVAQAGYRQIFEITNEFARLRFEEAQRIGCSQSKKGNSRSMKKTGFYVLMATCVLLLASCSGLNESAQNVKYATKSEAPKDCREIGEVSVGSFLPHVTMESVKN
jgi:hypothetical protein